MDQKIYQKQQTLYPHCNVIKFEVCKGINRIMMWVPKNPISVTLGFSINAP